MSAPDAAVLSALDRAILDLIQTEFPLVADPYAEIAARVGGTRDEIYGATASLRATGVIRRIGGTFSAQAMGYSSVLVAARVATDCLEDVAAAASAYPEVTHNYERPGHYNLWFTTIAETRARLDEILATLRGQRGVEALYGLPAMRTFKIRVDFSFDTRADRPTVPVPAQEVRPVPLEALDRQLIARLCGDLDASPTPFRQLATDTGLAEPALLDRLAGYRASGVMRRFGAILRHQHAGMRANGMSVWAIPPADVERAGAILSAQPEITHCYERPLFPDWPYNIYAMSHGPHERACQEVAARAAQQTGLTAYTILFSQREFKKTSMVYWG